MTGTLNSKFQFFFNTNVFFGPGERARLRDLVSTQGWKNIGFVVDHNIVGQPAVSELIHQIKTTADTVVVGKCEISEPTYDSLDLARKEFDGAALHAIVGIGGGSALDMAKAMAVLARNRQPAIFYRGFDKMTEPVLPIIAIPTTAGTGSEVTPNASFIDTKEKKKLGINGEAVRPRFAILDPELTLSCPERPTVSAGVDSLVHATEAYVAKKTNPLARLFAREGFRRVFNNLNKVIKAPADINLRSEVMYGAFLAGVALMNSGTGPAAAMSYPLGVHYKVPHGIGGAIFLPHVAGYNVTQGTSDYADLFAVMDGSNLGESRELQARAFVERLLSAWKELGIPQDLSELKIDAREFVQQTMQLRGALDQNPQPFLESEIELVLRRVHAISR